MAVTWGSFGVIWHHSECIWINPFKESKVFLYRLTVWGFLGCIWGYLACFECARSDYWFFIVFQWFYNGLLAFNRVT